MNSILYFTIIAFTVAQIPYSSRRPYGNYGSRPPYGSSGNAGFGGTSDIGGGGAIIFPDSPLYGSGPIGLGIQSSGGLGPGNGLGFGGDGHPVGGAGFGSQPVGGQGFGGLQPAGGQDFGGAQPVGGQGFGGGQSIGGQGFGSVQPVGGQEFGGGQSVGGQVFGGLQPAGGQGFGGAQPVGGQGFGGGQSVGGQGFGGAQFVGGQSFGGAQPIGGAGGSQTQTLCSPQHTGGHARNQGSDYHFSWCVDGGQKHTWESANQICTHLGTGWHSISIEDQVENAFVTQIIASHNLEYIWTGGQKSGATWVWPSGRLFIPLDWSHSGGLGLPQPDNQEDNNENCLAILNNFYQDGIKWHDVACYHPKPIICERNFAFG